MTVKPSLVALWLTDEVTCDEDGRASLHRLFNQITLTAGATEYDKPFTVFFSAVGVRKSCTCHLQLVDLSDLRVVYERQVILDQTEPMGILDVTIRVNNLPEIHPGGYAWELHLGDERLTSTRMTVVERA